MEVKLTADWILLHNNEVYTTNGKGCIVLYDFGFQYYLTELALETLDVEYECEELFDESDEDFKNPIYYFTIENIEDIKDSCPKLYLEFQKNIQYRLKQKKDDDAKRSIVLNFLDNPKTHCQIHKHLDNEFYKKQDDYDALKRWIKTHSDSLIGDLLREDLIKKTHNKYSLN